MYQSPRSPSMSPWSEVTTTTVSSARPCSSSASRMRADVVVDEGDRAVVAAPRGEHLLGRDRRSVGVDHRAQPARRRVDRHRAAPVRGGVDLDAVVAVPVLGRHLVRVVRMRERGDEQQRPRGSRGAVDDRAARPARAPPRRSRAAASPRTGPARSTLDEVVVPGQRSSSGEAPVGHPVEAGRVDVRSSAAPRTRAAGRGR